MPFLSVMHLRFDAFAPGAPFEKQSGSETSARCQSGVLDPDRGPEGREYALVHDGGFPSAGHAQAVGPVR